MKKFWETIRTPGLNYRAMYDDRKNRLVSVPPVEDVQRHLILTIVYSLVVIGFSGLLVTGLSALLGTLGMEEGILRDILASIPSGILLVAAFVVYAPRLGLFPGIFGSQVVLDDRNPTDKKVAQFIKDNPSRFNIDWYRDWAESPERRRKDMLDELMKVKKRVKNSETS